jgi:type I restriction enzyme S subunit
MNKKSPSPRAKAPERVAVKVIEASSVAEDAALELEAPAALVPKLRFPEFRDTGEWNTAPMGTLLKKSPDYGVNAAAVPLSEKLPKYLRITDISEDGRYLPERQMSVDIDATDENYLDKGDIVLARTGASVGKSYQYRVEDGSLVFAGFLIRVKPDPEQLVSTYLANFLTTTQFWKWVAVISARSGQPGINSTEYSSLRIPLPQSIYEQQRIADCLTSLDELIAAQGRKLDALKTHKSGLMQQLFPREGETFPSLRFPEFQDAGEWEEATLGSIGSFSSGGTPSKDNPNYWNGTIPWVSASSMYAITIKRADHYVTPLAIGNGTRIAKRGSILILVRGSMLFNRVPICVAGIDVAFNQDVKALDLATSINGTFILYQLLAFQSRFLINETGIGAGKIELDTLKGFGVGLPSFPEQQRIADCLSSLDTLITAEAQKLDALKIQKKGLMQELFP